MKNCTVSAKKPHGKLKDLNDAVMMLSSK